MDDMSSKRKRLSEANLPLRDGNDKHQIFTEWAKERGVQINGVEPARLEGRGLGLITTKQLKQGDRILFIPVKAMCQPDTALLKREGLERASPQAQLAISAMVAFRVPKSPLKVWEDTWPTLDDLEESLPMCWSDPRRRTSLPPSVNQPLERQLADYQKDWNAAKDFCAANSYSESTFKYYWMIVNSRSFGWKPRGSNRGSMVMCPFIDYLNHGPTGTSCRVTQSPNGYEVHTDRSYESGEELLATYGAHSNDSLLVHYGFVCSHVPDGPSVDDCIRIDHLIVPKLSAEIRDQLQDVGYLGSYALLPASNELCFKTQVAVRALILTCNEWEYFAGNGEDLGVDHTPEINAFVKDLFEVFCKPALARNIAFETPTVNRRWRQILGAMDKFSHEN